MVAEIKIVNVPPQLVAKLDALASDSEYPDRSAFLVATLEDFALFHDRYFLHCLPDTSRILIENMVKREGSQRDELLKLTLQSVRQNNDFMAQLLDVLSIDGNSAADEN